LLGRKGKKLAKRGINFYAIRAREHLEFLAFNQKFKSCYLTQKPLKVKSPILNKDLIFVVESFLWWNAGYGHSRKSSTQSFMQQVELIIAALPLPRPLAVLAFTVVYDVTSDIMRVSDTEFVFDVIHEN
jgi:hypothetical protein